MSEMIILTAEEALTVLGLAPPPDDWAAIEPVPIRTGEYVLPPDVMADPCHADVAPFLATLPTRDVPDEEFYTSDPTKPAPEADQLEYAAAKLDWKEPKTKRGTPEREAEVAVKVAEKAARGLK